MRQIPEEDQGLPANTKQRYVLKTLGCKANLYDSQRIEAELREEGWIPDREGKEDSSSPDSTVDLCIINSCTVTDEADRQTRKLAQKLALENPRAKVVVTGCAAEVDPDTLIESPGVHYVVGNQNKDKIVSLVLDRLKNETPSENPTGPVDQERCVEAAPLLSIDSHILKHPKPAPNERKILGTVQSYSEIISRHPHDREWPTIEDSFGTPRTDLDGFSKKTRTFLKIQEGCNSFCTYCIIPYGRGPTRSLRPHAILKQVKELVANGVREIVITGTNIGDYGLDWSSEAALGDLLTMVLEETELERLRVSSLDPTEITPQIIQLMKSNLRFCPHFHISLQSPSSRILRLMKRKYGLDEVRDCLTQIDALSSTQGLPGGAFVGMDLITGFPGESEEEFETGLETLSKLPWSRLHVFPYSERKGTPATRLTGVVPRDVRLRRSRQLNQFSMQRLIEKYRSVLSLCKSQNMTLDTVLTESAGRMTNAVSDTWGEKGPNWLSGYTSNYLRVLIPPVGGRHPSFRNQIVSVNPIDIMIDSRAHDVALIGQISSIKISSI